MQSSCRACQSVYADQHYQANKSSYYAKNQRFKERVQAAVSALKSVPCMDCGGTFPPYVMDFDHLGEKEFEISKAHNNSWASVLKEMAKCDIVCSNCHRIRTHKRRSR